MGNEIITSDMSMEDVIILMSERNPGAINVLMQMMNDTDITSFFNILYLDSAGIRGSKIWMLYSDCCNKNYKKFSRTLVALRNGAYSEEEIQENLGLSCAVPFLDDSIQFVSNGQEFGPGNDLWKEYIRLNREVVIPKIHEKIENQKKLKKFI